MNSKLLKVQKVAEVLDTAPQRVYELVRQGLISAVRMGRQARVDGEALYLWIKNGGTALASKDVVKPNAKLEPSHLDS
jgi:excisionase family DNA binding protein